MAIIPQLDPEPQLSCGAQPIGNSYMLLTAQDERDHLVRDAMQISALNKFLTQHGSPHWISDDNFSFQHWA